MADLLGDAVPPGPIGGSMSERHALLARLLEQISLLTGLLEAVGMAAVFSRQFPYRKTHEARGITRVAYLRYHYEHYLHEVYRIREALISTVNVVEKHAVKRVAAGEAKRLVRQHFAMLRKAILDGFDGSARTRGRIVHRELYSDAELSRMDTLQFYLQHTDTDAFKGLAVVHDEAYREKRAKIAREIERSHGELEKAIAETLAQLEPLVFDPGANGGAPDP